MVITSIQIFPKHAVRRAQLHEGGKKKRHMDEDAKKAIVERAAKKKASADAVGKMAMGDSVDMRLASTELLGAESIAQIRTYEAPGQVHCTAFDASRLSNPTEDTMLYASSDGERGSFPTPMVLGSHVPLHGHMFKFNQFWYIF